MISRILPTLTLCLTSICAADEPQIDFATQIKPLLSDRCFLCHGPDAETREADLRLDSLEGVMSPLASDESLYAVVAGDVDASELVSRITSEDSDLQMPPPNSGLSLNQEEKGLLKKWIAEGAEWKGHWAFEPITSRTLPEVESLDWCRNEIDRFVVARQESAGIPQNRMASKTRLIRRATFDLTGLPPTLEEIDAFLSDETAEAFEKVVDRLLASHRFGERMASDWLDVARYSDTYGYQVDRDRYVWPWRDWVVRAFNGNKAYDQFIIEQLAGDLMPDATRDQILATTFNRLHPQKVEGGSVPEEFRVEYVADRSQTMSTAFLGLTLECARCHDHKYDPISQKEYYQFFSFFNNIDEAGLYSYFTNSVPTPTLRLSTDDQQQTLRAARRKVLSAEARLQKTLQAARTETGADSVLDELAGGGFGFDRRSNESVEGPEVLPGQIAALTFESGNFSGNNLVDDRGGKVVELTGDNGIDVKVGNFPRWQPFTVATWIKTPKEFERCVVFHRSRAWTDAASRGYELLIEDGHLSTALIHFWPGNAIGIRAKSSLPVGEWVHVVMTYDGSSTAAGLKLWCDGLPCDTEIVQDNLYKNITGGGGDTITIGQRFRDVGFAGGRIDGFRVFNREVTPVEVAHLYDGRTLRNLLAEDIENLSIEDRGRLAEFVLRTRDTNVETSGSELLAARQQFNKIQDSLQEIMVMQEQQTPRKAYLLSRGAYDARADEVYAETPTWLPSMAADLPRNRLGLARWLTSEDHPLTARVAVNRFWQLVFGAGLVRSPEDFGSQGVVPTHPELLDWLARDFRQHGWDVKRLLRQMILSSTYRQSSQCTSELQISDPENQWLARAPVYRLTAESLRDNALFVSGLLNDQIGGPPARPYELAASFKPAKPDDGPGLYRRSLYTYWQRTAPAPVMMALDASKREVCRVRRERTASPLQALVVLNGPQFVEAGRGLAARLIKRHGENDQKILVDMFRMLSSRSPTADDAAVLVELKKIQVEHFRAHPSEMKQYLAVGKLKVEEDSIDDAELAAWASVANALFAFDECMMKR